MEQEKVKNFILQSRQAGVSDDEIYSFLASKNVVPPLQQPEQVQPEQTGGIKQVVTEPFRTLVGQPGIRAGQAIGSLGLMLANKLSGGKVSEAVKARTGQTLEERLPGVVGQDVVSPGGTLLSKGVKQFSEGGGQQVVGEMLQSASYLYPFGTVAGAAGRAVGSKVAGNVISGATGGYLADVGYGLAEGEGAEALKPGMGTIIGGAIPTVGPVLRGTTKLTQEAVGKLTGTSGQTLREFGAAIRAGGTQADEAVKALRGQTSPEQIVENAKNALSDIVKKRNDEYVSALSKISDDTKTYDITPIVKNLKTQLDNFGTVLTPDGNLDFSRSPIRFNKQAQSEIQTIFDELKGFGLKPGDRTAVGIDSLKRSFQDLYSESSEARAFVESMRKSTRDILKQVPGYDELTAKYSQDTELINELRKGLSLGDKAQIDTTFKKLVSVLRTNNEMRLQLAREINAVAGDTLIPQIAGQQLSEVLPRGIIGQIGGVIGGASLLSGVGILPVIQAALVSSPRLVGEVIRVLGIAGRGATKVKNLLVPKNINLQFPGDALLESNLGKQATKYAKDYAKNPKLGLSIQDVSRLSKEELDQLGLSQTLKASPKKNISKTASANDIPTKLPKSKVMSSDLSTEAKKYKSAEEFIKSQGEIVYHGTEKNNVGKIEKNGFKEGKTGDWGAGIYTTKDKTSADMYGDTFGGKTIEAVIPKNRIYEYKDFFFNKEKSSKDIAKRIIENNNVPETLKGINVDELAKRISETFSTENPKFWLEKAGYAGIKDADRIVSQIKDEIVIFNPEEIKTKSQLTEIWNKANKTGLPKAIKLIRNKDGSVTYGKQKMSSDLSTEAKKYKSAEEFVKEKTRNFGLPTRDVADEVYKEVYKGEKPVLFEVSKLSPTETQGTRELLGAEKFSEKQAGKSITNPIIVTEKGTILDGHNRYYQAIANGDKNIPAFILKEKEAYKSQLTDIWNKANKSALGNVDDLTTSIKKAKASGQSFDEWVNGQGETFYHGSKSDFDVFDKTKIKEAQFGQGLYATDIKKVAQNYGETLKEYIGKNNFATIDDVGGSDGYVKLAKNLYEKKYGKKFIPSKGTMSSGFDDFYYLKEVNSNKNIEAKNLVIEYLKNNGFDGLKLKQYSGDTTYLIFEPEKLKTRSQLKAEWDKIK